MIRLLKTYIAILNKVHYDLLNYQSAMKILSISLSNPAMKFISSSMSMIFPSRVCLDGLQFGYSK